MRAVHEAMEQLAMTDPRAQAVPAADPGVPRPAVPAQLAPPGCAAWPTRCSASPTGWPSWPRPGVPVLVAHGEADDAWRRPRRRRWRAGSAPATRWSRARSTPRRWRTHRGPSRCCWTSGRRRRGAPRVTVSLRARGLDRGGGPPRLLRPGQRHLAGAHRPDVLDRRAAGAAAAGAAPGRDGRRRAVLRGLPRRRRGRG